jgi:hypothetical protein
LKKHWIPEVGENPITSGFQTERMVVMVVMVVGSSITNQGDVYRPDQPSQKHGGYYTCRASLLSKK